MIEASLARRLQMDPERQLSVGEEKRQTTRGCRSRGGHRRRQWQSDGPELVVAVSELALGPRSEDRCIAHSGGCALHQRLWAGERFCLLGRVKRGDLGQHRRNAPKEEQGRKVPVGVKQGRRKRQERKNSVHGEGEGDAGKPGTEGVRRNCCWMRGIRREEVGGTAGQTRISKGRS